MGLMLSVLVFCVGVAEILDCWHHFLLHLVQPQYNPLPSHLDLKSDYLNDRELLHPLSESRRTSNIDICWPKDLSPDDNLHVIKKRTHSDVDSEISHRLGKKHYEIESSLTTSEGLPPDIVVHTPEPIDYLGSPIISRETSPNKLELGVIVESDSSSEVDEPSQIENLNYKKEKNEFVEHEELGGRCQEVSLPVSEILRPRCPSAKILEQECDDEHLERCYTTENTNECEVSDLQNLPVFTDNILSHDVMRISVHHPKNSEISKTSNVTENEVSRREVHKSKLNKEQKTLDENTGSFCDSTVQSISSLLEEGLEPIPEFPEIKIHESSPVSKADDSSDSSINTSDASWMVRSKTSDRPLIIRFDTSPQKVEQDFQSVVKTDLSAFGGNESHGVEDSVAKPLEKTDSVDLYYDAQTHQNEIDQNGRGTLVQHQNEIRLEENANLGELFDNGEVPSEPDVKPSSAYLMQVDSNSSSSSLSGIPALPEDTLESLNQISLPTDNGFSQNNDSLSIETSCSQYNDKESLSGLTSKDNHIEISSHIQEMPIENIKEITPENEPNEGLINNNSGKNNEGNVSLNEEIKVENNPTKKATKALPSPNIQKDNDIPERKESPDALSYKDQGLQVVKGDNASGAKDGDVLSFTCDDDSRLSQHKVSSSKEDNRKENKPINVSDESIKIGNEKQELTETKTSTISDHSKPKGNFDNNRKDRANLDVEKTQTKSLSCPPSEDRDKPNIPAHSEKCTKPIEAQKETLNLPKGGPSKKQTSKSSSKDSSTDSSDTVELCRAKEIDQEAQEETRAASASVKTNTVNDSSALKNTPAVAGTSKQMQDAKPSTSKSEEDKSFWLIFSGEYTKAMNKDWHSGHFCCWQCDESLTGQRYVLRDEHPYCVKCYESVFANGCEECNKIIGIDSKDLSYKDKHWHEACFLCNKCRVSLVDKQFGSKLEKIFCGSCYDQQFASRCDGCGQIFKAGLEHKLKTLQELSNSFFFTEFNSLFHRLLTLQKMPTFEMKCDQEDKTRFEIRMKEQDVERVVHSEGLPDDEKDDQHAYLSTFLPLEDCDKALAAKTLAFECCSQDLCTLGNPKDRTPGTKKMEYKTRQWHEPCFACCVCKSPIGTKSFIPREQEIYCATCYEEKFATRCVKCNKIITSGGVTYKNEPWHRECFTCTNCNSALAGQRFTSRDEKPYCADCFGELFAKRCTACSKPITGIGGTRFISFEDRHWHNDCFICASCKTSLVGRGFITDCDDIICPECAKQKLM